jgi:hypothetical protein
MGAIQHEQRLLAEPVVEQALAREAARRATRGQAHAVLDHQAELGTQELEILERAGMDVGGAVPRVGQAARHRHAAAKHQVAARAPVGVFIGLQLLMLVLSIQSI